ncbi:MAG: hypothetical protein K2U26_01625 [Cyclobacteriaceae bacterium]|nr:hypothetical protein [Cyclobacteriaceae bacterium]
MKQIVYLLLLVAATFSASAQQNLFNVPSGDMTPAREGFYQHQINIYSWQAQESKVHLTYGLGKKWDIGVNFVDLPLKWNNGLRLGRNDDPFNKPLYPVLMFTAQKQWILSEKWDVNIGTQAGPNLASGGSTSLAYWNYAGARYHFPKSLGFVIGGIYQSTPSYIGGNQEQVGYWFGYEYHLNHRWQLMGDLVSGQNKKSNATFGIVYNLSDKVQLCFARLFSFPNQTLASGFVFELNVFTYKYNNGH